MQNDGDYDTYSQYGGYNDKMYCSGYMKHGIIGKYYYEEYESKRNIAIRDKYGKLN